MKKLGALLIFICAASLVAQTIRKTIVENVEITAGTSILASSGSIVVSTLTVKDLLVCEKNINVSTITFKDGTILTSTATLRDNLGNHTATQDLNIAGYSITNVSRITSPDNALQLGDGSSFTFKIQNNPVLSIVSTNVGIGTSNPAEKLEVVGNIEIKNNNGLILQDNNGKRWKLKVDNNGVLYTEELP